MLNSSDFSKFFAIDQARIDRELDGVGGRLHEIARSLHDTPKDTIEPAERAHLRILLGCATRERDEFPKEHTTFTILWSLENVADDSALLAHCQGQLNEISSEMKAIERREGLKGGEYWTKGEGPIEYNRLSDEYDRISSKVRDTVIDEILIRYRLNDLATMREENPDYIDLEYEIGRRLAFPPEKGEEADTRIDSRLREKYGAEVTSKIENRIQAIYAEYPNYQRAPSQ